MRGIDTVLSLLTDRQHMARCSPEDALLESSITATAAEILANLSRLGDTARSIAVHQVGDAARGRGEWCVASNLHIHSD